MARAVNFMASPGDGAEKRWKSSSLQVTQEGLAEIYCNKTGSIFFGNRLLTSKASYLSRRTGELNEGKRIRGNTFARGQPVALSKFYLKRRIV